MGWWRETAPEALPALPANLLRSQHTRTSDCHRSPAVRLTQLLSFVGASCPQPLQGVCSTQPSWSALCRELLVLWLPPEIQGLLLPGRVGRAGDKGLPDTLHGLLQGPGQFLEEERSISGSTDGGLLVFLAPMPVGMVCEGPGGVAQWSPCSPASPECWPGLPLAAQCCCLAGTQLAELSWKGH